MIDLHCHVLPGVDDGPRTAEAAIALARDAHADGITTIAATPHVDSSHPLLDSSYIRSAVATLQAQLDEAGVEVEVLPGGEVAWTRALELDDPELTRLSLGGMGSVLLECPLTSTLMPGFTGMARKLAWRGHRILLAHPERCPIFLRAPEQLEELVEEGLLAQVTASSLTGRFGRAPRDLALRLVWSGGAHVIASDGHDDSRPATIARDLLEAGIEPELAFWLTSAVPAALLTGSELPARPSSSRSRSRGRLRGMSGLHSVRKVHQGFTRRGPA